MTTLANNVLGTPSVKHFRRFMMFEVAKFLPEPPNPPIPPHHLDITRAACDISILCA